MTLTRPTDLRTEFVSDPPGIDEREPDLCWRVDTDRRGAHQTAYRVLVASSRERLADDEGDIWDTGKQKSSQPSIPYDGLTLESGTDYHWKVRIWDGDDESPWSDPAMWGMGLLESDDWDANWIRRPSEIDIDGATDFERGQFTYARREFALPDDASVERARASVAASHQYELSVNGERVDRGQSFSYPDHHYYKTIDLADALETGENAIGALFTWHGEGQGRPTGEPGFLCQLEIELADGSERTIVTDEAWRLREAEWDEDAPVRNEEVGEAVELIDGRDAPSDWAGPGFDDETWKPAGVIGRHPTEPWERLIAQNREVVGSQVEPVTVTRVDDETYVADFGRIYAGIPEITFKGGTAGHRVDVRAGYRLRGDRMVDEQEGTQWTDMHYAYVQRDGDCTFRPFNYLGVRYLQIDAPGEELDPEQVSLRALHNEVPDEHAATFESSNETVDDVFELARHSTLYGCQEQFIDTPTREKGQFLVDALNISAVSTRAFGERALTRQAIREFVRSHYRYWVAEGRINAVYPNGDGKRDIPDFTEAFPEWVWQYYRMSGDRSILEAAYPVVRAITEYIADHVDAETGLVMNLSGGEGGPYEEGIVDWPPEMRYGYDRDWPARTTINILGANAFAKAAAIAEELECPGGELERYRERRAALESAVQEHLFDGELYVDGCGASGRSESRSQHANALALAFGLVPDEAIDRVADHVAEMGMQMGPMMVPWLCEALEAADRTDALVDLLTNPDDDGWANILEQGGTFTWETWHCRDPDLPTSERRNRSESHAMGGPVLVSIQRALLGVRLAEREGSHLEIRPPASGLEAASGRVPTERGTVDVSWSREGETFDLEVTVPWNATASVVLPVDADAVRVNGTVLSTTDSSSSKPDPSSGPALEGVTATRLGEAVSIDVESGRYRFELE
ncbi:family 78 glycoside hydrolase catalytic domain [Halostagnicola sp. A-GB9-2]|uniref:family 78 glycoside hydrolase catalytic domain n=1 Tax=Halostagnicola sp. A-GB9-2 TaxID=3048066 RepID=UPI0024BF1FE0|nr:family 78 glycoside hydrolase catalytic domain [Halostagnicola sp. A-GB9-2]MDJ1433243.1 family 78 glycoside hydrolase catalytic domain [Halostagnicola sp. A-GB9-2]